MYSLIFIFIWLFQLMLKRHMRIVHKIYSVKSNRSGAIHDAPNTPNSNSTNAGPSNSIRVKEEAVEPSDEGDDDEEEDIDSSPAPSPSDSTGISKGVSVAHSAVKEEEASSSPKMASSLSSSTSRGGNMCSGGIAAKMTKLSVGFDFKQLFCKLCKRQFSSRQNLTKHIELHTDGNDIFIKFYRCPLCRYESRRKRDVLRHVTVVHKKSSAYLGKIMPKLESRAVKRLAEVVLSSTHSNKRTSSAKEEVNGRHASSSSSSSTSHPVTRKQECATAALASVSASSSPAPPPAPVTRKQQDLSSPAFNPSPPVTRKQERQQTHQHRSVSPPLTRRSEKHTHQRNSSSTTSPNNQPPHSRRHDTQSENTGTSSTEVRVTKNFSLHACDQCGRAFAKKVFEFKFVSKRCFHNSK